ncbi:MAG: putative toxin-antitoxin system toxin component, PIN family [Gammaproteobacteria bacterium]
MLDTNVVVAGLLWNGPPRRLLDMAIDEGVYLCTSGVLIDELKETLSYAKFAQRIARFGSSVPILVARYEALVTEVSVPATPRVVVNDPDDDHVLACAMAARADMIVSGDRHFARSREL